MQKDLLLFDQFPETFREDVVTPGALFIHADFDLMGFQHAGEGFAGELAALITVENFRLAVFDQGFLQRLDAKISIHRDRYPMAENAPARPVDNCHQINISENHRDIGEVHRSDLVQPSNLQSAQHIRINLVPRGGLERIGAAVDCLDAHAPDQRRHMTAADGKAFPLHHVAKHPGTSERTVQVQLIDAAHQRQVIWRYRSRLVIDAAAADVQSLRLSDNRQFVIAIYHRFALSIPELMSAPSKKSFSNASCAILKLVAPSRDLVHVGIKLLGMLGKRLVALHSCQRNFSLENRCVVPAGSLWHNLS